MRIKKIIGIAAIVVLCGIAVFSGVVFHHQYQDQKNSPVRDRGILWRRVSSPVSGSKEQRAAV